MSRPSRARGLKRVGVGGASVRRVAPLAGAWIETIRNSPSSVTSACRAPRGRVD